MPNYPQNNRYRARRRLLCDEDFLEFIQDIEQTRVNLQTEIDELGGVITRARQASKNWMYAFSAKKRRRVTITPGRPHDMPGIVKPSSYQVECSPEHLCNVCLREEARREGFDYEEI